MKQIENFPNYFVTEDGRVWGSRRKHVLKPNLTTTGGYLQVCLCAGGKRKTRKVHSIVLEAFVGPCPEGMECRHLDGDRTNNSLDNLVWGTAKENAQDRDAHGNWKPAEGEQHGGAKLTESKVKLIRLLYRAKQLKFTQVELSELFGVVPSVICNIVRNRCWRSVA